MIHKYLVWIGWSKCDFNTSKHFMLFSIMLYSNDAHDLEDSLHRQPDPHWLHQISHKRKEIC